MLCNLKVFSPQQLKLTVLVTKVNTQETYALHQFCGTAKRPVVIFFMKSSTAAADVKSWAECWTVSHWQSWWFQCYGSECGVSHWLWLFSLDCSRKKKIREQNQYIPFVSIDLVNTDCNQRACTLTRDFSLPALFSSNSIVIF